MPLKHFLKVFEVGVYATADTNFGTQVGATLETNGFSDFGAAINRSSTVLGPMKVMCGLASRQATTLNTWIKNVGDGYLICRKQFARLPGMELSSAQVERYTLTFMANFVRQGAGADWYPPKVFLANSLELMAPEDDFFPISALYFEHPYSAILLPYSVASKPVPKTDAQVSETMSEKAMASVDWAEPDIVVSLRAPLRSFAMQGGASFDLITDLTGMSERTIQRRLWEQGTSTRTLNNEAKSETAKELLAQADADIADISGTLGYRNPAHFSRSFHNAVGMRPRDYRRSANAEQ